MISTSAAAAGASDASAGAASVFVVVREEGGFDSHTLVREASIRGAISAARARSTKGCVILTRPILRLKGGSPQFVRSGVFGCGRRSAAGCVAVCTCLSFVIATCV